LEALVRNAFIDELVALARAHEHVALVVGDLGYSVVEPFADQFPDRFINAGVAEQNMTGLAAGMASEGYHVFTYSIANFPTFRCAEQIRNDVDYQQLAVTVVAVGGGLAYGALGYSHHAVQDYALMRMMPNTLIAAPGDPMEVRACLRYLVTHPQPSYLRLGKAGEPCFHADVPAVEPGRWLQIKGRGEGAGPRRALLTTGASLTSAMEWSVDTSLAGVEVHSLPLWGMSTKAVQRAQACDFERLVTIEDHLTDGGFGSWLREAIANDGAHVGHIRTLGLSASVCGLVGGQATLNRIGGLDLDGVRSGLGDAGR
jgi:transketolase